MTTNKIYMSDKIIKNIEQLYKIDFDCTNYTFERFIERNI